MKSSILIEILQSFSTNEIKELGEFIRSPFYNKNESVIKLYDYLRKYYPEFPEDKIEKETVYRKIFSGTQYNDGFMRKVIFQLSRLGENYLSYIAGTKDTIKLRIDLLGELNIRKLGKSFKKYYPELSRDVDKNQYKDHNYYQNKYSLETLITNSMNNIRYKVDLHDKKLSYNEHVIRKLQWLRNYFLSVSLNTYRYLNYQGYTDQFEFSDEVLDLIIDFLLEGDNDLTNKGLKFKEDPIIKLHINEIMLMKVKNESKNIGNDKYYLILKKALMVHNKQFTHDAMFSLYNILHQHCIYKILRGFSDYRKERFELDKIALERDIYRPAGEDNFPPPAFASLVRDASEMGETGWAESFINKYEKFLEKVNYETVINLSYAHINFSKKDFTKALKHLNKIKPIKRWEFKFGVKELTLLTYYELSMFNEIYYLLDSFRHFISSMGAHFSKNRIISRNNFIKYYSKLIKAKDRHKKIDLTEMILDLKNTELVIFGREWLMEKVKELESRTYK